MTTLRKRFKQGFTTVPNRSAADRRLSLRARGLLVYLLSKPDNWQVRSAQIAADVPDGRDGIQVAMRELAHYGYYRIIDERLAGAIMRITDVSDSPVNEPGWGHHAIPDDPDERASLVCETCREIAGLPRNKKRATWPRRQEQERDCPAPVSPAPERPAPDSPARLEDRFNKESKTPSPNPSTLPERPLTPVGVEEINLRELAAELRVIRRENDLPERRWTDKAVAKALTDAIAAGFPLNGALHAFRIVAADPVTQQPGRLKGAGPWWDALELGDIDQRRNERKQRAATCARCNGTGMEDLGDDVVRRCNHEGAQTA